LNRTFDGGLAGDAAMFLLMFLCGVFETGRNNGAITRLALHQQSNIGVRVPA
jgi:hypothetical protein